jgi:hypothetical protein
MRRRDWEFQPSGRAYVEGLSARFIMIPHLRRPSPKLTADVRHFCSDEYRHGKYEREH